MLPFRLFTCLLLSAAASSALEPPPAERGVDHAKLVRALNGESLKRGETLYASMCLACHGTPEKPGSLPDSRAFWKDPFKNGADPFGIYRTLTLGLGQMPPWPMLTPVQKYDLAHYVRESFVKPANPAAYIPITRNYLKALPKPDGKFEETAEMKEFKKGPKHQRMDFGPAFMWTLAVGKENIAGKGIAVRLDDGPGGVTKGRAWMLYDHDTMRVAAAWTGDGFVDWRGIAFDGTHCTHTSIRGERAFVNPDAPGWADPATGGYKESRLLGSDGRPYGPLPRAWMRYLGTHRYGPHSIIACTVGNANILESPACEVVDGKLVFTRTLEIGLCGHALEMRVADETRKVVITGGEVSSLAISNGFHVLRVPARNNVERVKVSVVSDLAAPSGFRPLAAVNADLTSLTKGGPQHWPSPLTSQTLPETTGDGIAYDTLAFPDAERNPWQTQWRLGGLDFFSDGKRMAVCTWMGDVWTVDGILDPSGKLTWRRIASGLFQPAGLKIVNDVVHVCCRDQIVRLVDRNGDGETDFYECFNNDHQVTEHFHDFAMGLQTDSQGNFYYAKSARHGLDSVVPQHGTLLKVSRDGSKTEILANGFRAANGVCVNDDGTCYVTDQEGFWTPDNRINLVKTGGFYGNMWSYGAPKDSADSAMEQPVMWITKKFNRSPGELVRITTPAWGPLHRRMVELSYGTGRMFLILEDGNDASQGVAVALPVADFPTGVMRGRFHPATGDLYTCGMAVWASNKTQDGGLYRVRRTATPLHMPVAWSTAKGHITMTLSDPLDRAGAADISRYTLTVWDTKRTEDYGSPHFKERRLSIAAATLAEDARTLTLRVDELAPTCGLLLECRLPGADGKDYSRTLNGTIHHCTEP
jgi:cytochrome c5